MRHGNKVKKLGRTHAHRKATLASMSSALITHKRITTTLAKAKALRGFVEPIINRSKDDSTASRRQAFRRLQDKEAVKTLFGEIADAVGDRPGGYTRVVKLGQRAGDAAEMAVIELVDFNDVKPEGGSTKKKTRRGRRSSSSTPSTPKAASKKAEPKAAATASAQDDFTKLWGIGPVFAEALQSAGLTTFAQLADADLDTLRGAINAGSDSSDANANEETWAAQARLAAAGDWDGHADLIERLKAEGATAHDASEGDVSAAAETMPEAAAPSDAPEVQEAEAVATDAATPDATGNPQVAPSADEHPDAEQGAPTQTGEPGPEADATNQGRSGEQRG